MKHRLKGLLALLLAMAMAMTSLTMPAMAATTIRVVFFEDEVPNDPNYLLSTNNMVNLTLDANISEHLNPLGELSSWKIWSTMYDEDAGGNPANQCLYTGNSSDTTISSNKYNFTDNCIYYVELDYSYKKYKFSVTDPVGTYFTFTSDVKNQGFATANQLNGRRIIASITDSNGNEIHRTTISTGTDFWSFLNKKSSCLTQVKNDDGTYYFSNLTLKLSLPQITCHKDFSISNGFEEIDPLSFSDSCAMINKDSDSISVKWIVPCMTENHLWYVYYENYNTAGYVTKYITGDELSDEIKSHLDANYFYCYYIDTMLVVSSIKTEAEIPDDEAMGTLLKENSGNYVTTLLELPVNIQSLAKTANVVDVNYHTASGWKLWGAYVYGEILVTGATQPEQLASGDDFQYTSSSGFANIPVIQFTGTDPIDFVIPCDEGDITYTYENHTAFPTGAAKYTFTYDSTSTIVTSSDELWSCITSIVDSGAKYDKTKASLTAIAPIDSIALTVAAPAAGTDLAATAATTDTTYSTQSMTWTPGDTTAKYNTEYSVSVTVTPAGVNYFAVSPTATVNTNTASAVKNADGTVTVSYTFDKTAAAKVSGIELTKPTKLEYFVGDTLDLTGGKLTVSYEDGRTPEEVTLTADMVSGFDSTTAGDKTITVTYSGLTTTFTVKVSEKPVENPDDGKDDDKNNDWKIEDDGNGNLIINVPDNGGNIPKDVFDNIKNSGQDVTIKYPDGYNWTIKGDTIDPSKIPNDGIDLSFTTDTAYIFNMVTGYKYSMSISIKYSGEFGFTAILEIDLSEGMENAPEGKYFANLYLIDSSDKNKLTWTTYSEIDSNNNAHLEFTHASDWAIVIDRTILDGNTINNININVDEPSYNSNTSTPTTDSTQASIDSFTWTPAPSDGKFEKDTEYTLTVVIKLNDDQRLSQDFYVLLNDEDIAFTNNGDGTLTITYTFNETNHPSYSGGGYNRPHSGGSITPAMTSKSTGWDAITKEINNAEPGSTITVTLNDETSASTAALKAAQDKNVTLVLKTDLGIIWTLKGSELSSERSIDFSATTENVGIPEVVLNNMTGDSQFVFRCDTGLLDFKTSVSVPLGKDNAGKNAAIYRWLNGKMVYIGSSAIDKDGNAVFSGVSGRRYCVVIGGTPDSSVSDLIKSLLLGDANDDLKINAFDASALLKFIVYGYNINELAADTDQNGIPDKEDVKRILLYTIGKLTSFN